DLLRGAQRNENGVIFFVLAKEAGFPFFQHADNLEVVTAHPDFGAGDPAGLSREQSFGRVDSDDHDVATPFVVRFSNETAFAHHYVCDVQVIWRHALSVAPAIVVTLVSDVGVERAALVTDVRGGDSQILNRRGVLFDRIGGGNGQRFTHPFRSIF